MTQRPCKAEHPTTCRYHGGAARALAVIDQQILKTSGTSNLAALKLLELKRAAESFDPKKPVTGLFVEFEDGSSTFFYGDSTDTTHYSDWNMISADGNNFLISGGKDTDMVHDSDKNKTVEQTKEKYTELLEGTEILFTEGEDTFPSGKRVKTVSAL